MHVSTTAHSVGTCCVAFATDNRLEPAGPTAQVQTGARSPPKPDPCRRPVVFRAFPWLWCMSHVFDVAALQTLHHPRISLGFFALREREPTLFPKPLKRPKQISLRTALHLVPWRLVGSSCLAEHQDDMRTQDSDASVGDLGLRVNGVLDSREIFCRTTNSMALRSVPSSQQKKQQKQATHDAFDP